MLFGEQSHCTYRQQRSDDTAGFPANVPGVIGVTAVDIHLQPYAEANRAAPGVRIWTPGPASGSYHIGRPLRHHS